MRRDAWQALADPTRREIIKILSQNSLTINEIAEKFDISRPATSKHLKILSESNLIEINSRGRERICNLTLESLEEVYNWVKEYEIFWIGKLDNLDKFMKNKKQRNKK